MIDKRCDTPAACQQHSLTGLFTAETQVKTNHPAQGFDSAREEEYWYMFQEISYKSSAQLVNETPTQSHKTLWNQITDCVNMYFSPPQNGSLFNGNKKGIKFYCHTICARQLSWDHIDIFPM